MTPLNVNHARQNRLQFAMSILVWSCVLVWISAARGQTDQISQLIGQLEYSKCRAAGHGGCTVRIAAAIALGKTKDPRAVEPLIAALKDKDEDTRKEAALGLGKIGDLRAVEPLITVLKDKHSHIQWAAACALGDLHDLRAVDPLIGALNDKSPAVRGEALEALGKFKYPRAVEPLINALKDKVASCRRDAAKALGDIGDARAVGPLIATFVDKNYFINPEDALATYFQGTPASVVQDQIAYTRAQVDVRRWAGAALVKIGTPAVEPLITALKGGEPWSRLVAADTLSKISDPRVASALLTALRERNVAAIAGDYMFFVKQGEPGSEDALVEALNTFGDAGMAQSFMNCGNTKLEQAGRDWAKGHGYQTLQFAVPEGQRTWGSKQ